VKNDHIIIIDIETVLIDDDINDSNMMKMTN